MREISLFSGAGGGLLATKHLLGWETVGYVEIDDYCQRVIRQRITDGLLDEAPIFGDIRAFISEGYAESYKGMVDVITGGFPCQDISAAGKGAGITGERSGLWKSMSDVVRIIRPQYVLVENSPMLTIRGLGVVLGDLAEMGFDARWGVFSAADVGACHIRERIWILAYSNQMGRKICFQQEPMGSLSRYRVDFMEQSQFATNTHRVRSDDGVAHWMDRIGTCGNGQVPAVVRAAWELLTCHAE